MTVSASDGSGQRASQERVLQDSSQPWEFGRCGQTLRETPEGDADGLSRGQLLPTPHPLVSLVVGLSVLCVYGLISQSSMYSRHFLNQEEFIESLSCARPQGTR